MISFDNFESIDLETDIAIITLDDNLLHTYFAKVSWEKDIFISTGTAKLIIPYSTDIEKYWSTYNGAVIVHANLNSLQKIGKMFSLSSKKNVRQEKDKNKIRIQNNQYNYSFIGKIHRFQQIGKTFVIYLKDLGWKFSQKVPEDFRKKYIAGQTLDNAFQAICELMGIEFAYSIEDLSKYNFATDGYSVEKDGQIIEDTPSIFEGFKSKEEEKEEQEIKTEDEHMGESLASPDFESSELIQQKKIEANNQTTETLTVNNNTTESEEENPKIDQYEEDFHEKIKDLFKGNTLYNSNISDPILNYDLITVEPTSTTTNDIQSMTDGTTPSGSSTENAQNETASNQQSSSASSSSSKTGVAGVWGKTAAGGYYLTEDAINKMSMAEAKRRYEYGKAHEPYYTRATMEKLWYRMMFGTKFF